VTLPSTELAFINKYSRNHIEQPIHDIIEMMVVRKSLTFIKAIKAYIHFSSFKINDSKNFYRNHSRFIEKSNATKLQKVPINNKLLPKLTHSSSQRTM